MTTIAVLVDPPRPDLVLPDIAETTPLSPEQCGDLYAAMTRDVVRTITTSGGDLLVNFRPDESLPESHRRGEGTAETEIREVVSSVVDDARFERQARRSPGARATPRATCSTPRRCSRSEFSRPKPSSPPASRWTPPR